MGSDKSKKCENRDNAHCYPPELCVLTDVIEACFNCTKRRIVCDLTPNKCKKCEKKGLECPGYGVRYRFTNGQTVSPSEIGPSEGSGASFAQSTKRRNSLKWINGSKRTRKRPDIESGASDLIPRKSAVPEGAVGNHGDVDKVLGQRRVNNEETHGRDGQTTSSLQTEHEEQIRHLPHDEPATYHGGSAVIEVTRDNWLPTGPAPPLTMFNLLPFLTNRDPRMRLLFDHCMSGDFSIRSELILTCFS